MTEPLFSRIVVAVCSGSTAEQVQTATASLAAGTGTDVLFILVAQHNPSCGAPDHPALHEHERELLRLLVEDMTSRGIRSCGEHLVTVSGRIAEHLLDAVAELHGTSRSSQPSDCEGSWAAPSAG